MDCVNTKRSYERDTGREHVQHGFTGFPKRFTSLDLGESLYVQIQGRKTLLHYEINGNWLSMPINIQLSLIS